MRFPTIDQTRAMLQLIAAVTLAIAFLYLTITGQLSERLLEAVFAAVMAVVTGVNGLALHKRNSTGKAWDAQHIEQPEEQKEV